MHGFGASGPQPALYEHFGFTPENVANEGAGSLDRLASQGLKERHPWQPPHRK